MKEAIVFGAGNIGRGFIGQLFSESGYAVTLVDVDQPSARRAESAWRVYHSLWSPTSNPMR